MVEVGTWKNFDDIEESLILDELLLLVNSLGKKQKNNFRMLAASQGYDIPDDDEEDMVDGDDDLPEELLEAERALQARKREQLGPNAKTQEIATEGGLGIGYEGSTHAVNDILDQSVI